MSHKANLIPGGHKLTPEENSRGGINGAKSRKERKQVQDLARAILDMPLHNDMVIDADDLPSLNDIESSNVDVKTKIVATLAIKALKGNVKATETLLTLSGDYVTRQETKIEMADDLEKAEYHIKVIDQDITTYEMVFYDDNGNVTKRIYGDEAKRLGEMKDSWTEDYQISIHIDEDEEIADTFIIPDVPMHK